MQRRDWLLLALQCAKRPLSPVQLQKSLFLLGDKLPAEVIGEGFYRFVPYNYGPFSTEVYHDVEGLAREGLALDVCVPGGVRNFAVSPMGNEVATNVRNQLHPSYTDYVSQVVNWVQSLSFNDLLKAIYSAYPNYKVNSVFHS